MTQVIPKSRSRKVNGYVKAVLALQAVRRKREDRYERLVRPLDRKRDELAGQPSTAARWIGRSEFHQRTGQGLTTPVPLLPGSVRVLTGFLLASDVLPPLGQG